ncbi:hypothetical protein GCM10010172_24670 [Paractinoplanes ferrugineus]|uniref:Uncharacterized protein n=1 Tax=Paractinoplanes ferrugineus TaxID=113564 RepID=A0A919IWK0_9ACTN|nr:hypothetical protein Afe05nite_04630 [Actinoplanes ferrugineus]
MRVVRRGERRGPVPPPVDGRNRSADGYLAGRADARQPDAVAGGRADLAQEDGGRGRAGAEFIALDLAASKVTRAASSRSVGVPRTTLTRGSASIDRAYDV